MIGSGYQFVSFSFFAWIAERSTRSALNLDFSGLESPPDSGLVSFAFPALRIASNAITVAVYATVNLLNLYLID